MFCLLCSALGVREISDSVTHDFIHHIKSFFITLFIFESLSPHVVYACTCRLSLALLLPFDVPAVAHPDPRVRRYKDSRYTASGDTFLAAEAALHVWSLCNTGNAMPEGSQCDLWLEGPFCIHDVSVGV